MKSALAALDDELGLGVSVYNAGYAPFGDFLDVALEDKLKVIDVNARGLLIWADVLGLGMVERGRGALVLVSSMAGFHGSARCWVKGYGKSWGTTEWM